MQKQQEQALIDAFRLLSQDDREFHLFSIQRDAAKEAPAKPKLRLVSDNTGSLGPIQFLSAAGGL